MRIAILLFLCIISGCTCSDEPKEEVAIVDESKLEIPFDYIKWVKKEGNNYPFREQMLNNVIFNDSIRSLKRDALIDALGPPTRAQDEFLYYRISENNALFMTLSARSLVIKLKGDDSVEWMKIHG